MYSDFWSSSKDFRGFNSLVNFFRTKIRIVKSGVLPVLLELLQSRSEAILELIAAALLVLSSCRQNKLAIVSSGAIQPLVDIFLNPEQNCVCKDTNNNSISIQSKIDVISTLHNLSTCRRIIPLIVSSGVTNSLLHIIQTSGKSIELAEKAISLLENIVYSSEEVIQEMVVIGNTVRVMVEVMEEGSSRCKEHAVAILVNICRSCRDRYRLAILREGVMPGLLQLSVDGTWRAQNLAQELLLLLRDESGYGSRSKRSQNEEMIEQIMSEIESEGERVNEKTLRQIEKMIANLST